MLNNFIYVKTKNLFLDQLETGNISDEAVVFIEDTKEIWNHGTYFDCKAVDYKSWSIPIIKHISTTVQIKPNVLNVWGRVDNLNISFAKVEDQNIVNEYMIQFESGNAGTTLSLPSNLKWVSVPEIAENKIYQISIINNLAVIGEFSNE